MLSPFPKFPIRICFGFRISDFGFQISDFKFPRLNSRTPPLPAAWGTGVIAKLEQDRLRCFQSICRGLEHLIYPRQLIKMVNARQFVRTNLSINSLNETMTAIAQLQMDVSQFLPVKL